MSCILVALAGAVLHAQDRGRDPPSRSFGAVHATVETQQTIRQYQLEREGKAFRLVGLGASATGIYVGSRADFEAMNRFLTEHKIRPVVDRAFSFEEAAKGVRVYG